MCAKVDSTLQNEEEEDTILRLEDVSVRYEMNRGVSTVVDNVSADINRNEILGIVGESGSGKSMVASSLLDAVPSPGQTTGTVEYYPVDGGDPVDVLSLSDDELRSFRWETVSMVFQGAMSSFNPTMKIRGHVEETVKAHNRDLVDRMSFMRDLIRDLHMDPDYILDAYPHELSGGMKQRALIALSLVLEPEVLVMDEPTASLDLLMQRSIVNLIADIQEEYDLTILFITHDLPLISGLVDRVAVMYAFELIEVGERNEILQNPSHPYTRALLNAVPNMNTSVDQMQPIAGSAPDPVNVPEGCSYHPRCPLADDHCRSDDPDLLDISETHTAACFYWEDVENEIPYSLGEEGHVSSDQYARDVTAQGVEIADGEEPLVSLNNVNVNFEHNEGIFDSLLGGDADNVVTAVDDVSLEIAENDIVALIGESGCGKTTLGKTTIGLQRPTDGAVEYRGQDVWAAKDGLGTPDIAYRQIRRALQIIHQDPGSSLNPNQTIQASLIAPIKKYRPDLGPEERQNLVHSVLERLNMEPASDYASRFPHELSGGEQQRTALGRALLLLPDLILADESVSALDVSLRVEMMDLMLELQEQFNTSFLFISHDFANARYVTTKTDGRIGVMYLGSLIEIGPGEEVLKNPKHPYTKALVWSTPPLDPDEADRVIDQDPPIRQIDVPNPENAPSGCKFHTRCEKIIPPKEIDIEQEAYNEIVDFRLAVANRDFDPESVWNQLDAASDDDPDEDMVASFVSTVKREHFSVDMREEHSERIERAIEHLARDDREAATALLNDHYESVCEREEPELRDSHPVACHLF